jgi:hypothetical protein
VAEDQGVLGLGVFTDDGGLFDLGWYLSWTPGNNAAILDGRFTAADLRAIADHMDHHFPVAPSPTHDLERCSCGTRLRGCACDEQHEVRVVKQACYTCVHEVPCG